LAVVSKAKYRHGNVLFTDRKQPEGYWGHVSSNDVHNQSSILPGQLE